MIIVNLLIISSHLFSPFMSNVSMAHYEKMALDLDKTRIIIRTVIPQNTIENTARCNKVLEQMDRIIKVVEGYDALVSRQGRVIIHLYLTYGSNPEDFQKPFTIMDEAREEAQKVIMDSRFKMKDLMTSEEWKVVFSPQGETDAKHSN
jgi:hypothetical protein